MIDDMKVCQRCGEPSVVATRKQNFCGDCFVKFIRGKQRKMMQALADNNSSKGKVVDVLLPMNYEFSNTSFVNFSNSITLLDILINYSKDLYKAHFKITILFLVEDQNVDRIDEIKRFFQTLKEYYNFFNIELKILDLFFFIQSNESMCKVDISQNSAFICPESLSYKSFDEYILSISNSSTREDLLFNVHWSVIRVFAYLHDFSVVLFSNSMNNIATKILSNVVKGKGVEISQILDEEQCMTTLDGKRYTFKALYPMKDVFNKEVVDYIDLLGLTRFLSENLREMYYQINHEDTGSNNKIVNVKTATLNQLVNDYFNGLEKNGYSTIVSTVVSTGLRLTLPKGDLIECPICKFKMPGNATQWLSNITVNSSCDDVENLIKEQDHPGAPVGACYGCLLTFSSSGNQALWPVNQLPSSEDKEILDEYTISDDEEEEN